MGVLTNTTAEIQESLDGVFGEIYTHENSTTQSIPTGATYTKVINFDANGESNNCTPDFTNSKITITKPGTYFVSCPVSFTEAGSNENWFMSIFADGVEQDDIHFERRIGTGGDYGSASMSGFISASSAIDVDLRVRHDNAGARTLTVRYCNLSVNRVSI
jgi:hypothetical protein